MRSMTGFGRGVAAFGDGQIVVEMKSVNHRFLEIRTRLPGELGQLEVVLEKRIRKRLSRGYCNVHVSVEQDNTGAVSLNKQKLAKYIDALKKTADQTGVAVETISGVLANAPDLFELPLSGDAPEVQDACIAATEHAIDKLLDMRNTEGANMSIDLNERLTDILNMVDTVQTLAGEFERSVFDKYKHKIADILAAHHSPDSQDEKRIETEAAIIAEKADITEEITRLKSHVEQMRTTFNADSPIGRRLDFLVQEMGREANTIASKSVLSQVTHIVVGIKSELEKIKEQVQNVE